MRVVAIIVLLAACSKARPGTSPTILGDGTSGGSSAGSTGTHTSAGGGSTSAGASAGTSSGTSAGASAGSSAGDGFVATGAVIAGAAGCGVLTHTAGPGGSTSGFSADVYAWDDASCARRGVDLARNTGGGTLARYGGEIEMYRYSDSQGAHALTGPEGFGTIVGHLNGYGTGNGEDDSPLGTSGCDGTPCNHNPAYATIFAGDHHAIHEYSYNYPRWGSDGVRYDVPVTIQWVMATGRSDMLFSVSFDLSAAAANVIKSDSRAPYGELYLSDQGDRTAGGVFWANTYRLFSNDTMAASAGGFTLNVGWKCTEANTAAAYTGQYELASEGRAETGLSGVRILAKQDAGGYSNSPTTLNKDNWAGTTTHTCKQLYDHPTHACAFPAPEWPFQAMEYGASDADTVYHYDNKLTWGSDWGTLGQQSFTSNNGTPVTGWPRVSYSVFYIMGDHTQTPVLDTAAEAETVDATVLTASVGSVLTSGPAGVARTDSVDYAPTGFNHIYATWEVAAASNQAVLQMAVPLTTPTYGHAGLRHPMFVVHGLTGLMPVRLDGALLVSGSDYFASVRLDNGDVWITLNATLTGTHQLRIGL